MQTQTLARLIWAVNAVAGVLVLSLTAYAFGQPGVTSPDQPVLAAAASTMSLAQTAALVTLPAAALAGSVLFARIGRR